MAKMRTYKGEWKSDQAEAKFRAKEAVLWSRAKRSYDAIDVSGSFGKTRAYRWAGTGTPIVFLHGMTDTSVRWTPFAAALEGHDVYAIDVMGDVGHSKPDVGFASADDYQVWLGEALDALGLANAHLVGWSLGGFIATSYAARPDSACSSLTCFDPVGVVELSLAKLMSWSSRAAIGSLAPEPLRLRLAKSWRQPLLADTASLAMSRATMGHPIATPPCPIFTDEQLRSITAPVGVLVGAHSKMFDVDLLVERMSTLPPHGQARLLPGAGHGLAMSHVDDCLALVREAIGATV